MAEAATRHNSYDAFDVELHVVTRKFIFDIKYSLDLQSTRWFDPRFDQKRFGVNGVSAFPQEPNIPSDSSASLHTTTRATEYRHS